MFAILKTPQDWTTFQLQFLQQLNDQKIAMGVGFQSGPTTYPCLIDAFVVPPAPIFCCFVYPPDAARLLLAAGVQDMQAGQPPAAPPETARIQDKIDTMQSDAAIDQQEVMNRHVSAMLLVISELLVQTAIVKQVDFERRLCDAQRLIDEIVTAKKDQLGLETNLAEETRLVLTKLGFAVDDLKKV